VGGAPFAVKGAGFALRFDVFVFSGCPTLPRFLGRVGVQ
jgi:hypothetical protein